MSYMFPEAFDYGEVLIVPKSSQIDSRSKVNLLTSMKFRSSDSDKENEISWKGIPIVASNMDSTGTFEVYNVLSKHKMLTVLSKHYTKEDFLNAKDNGVELNKEYFMVSSGISDSDIKKLDDILSEVDVKWICVDIANGYLDNLQSTCKYLSNKYKDKILVAGNVATPEMIKPLKDSGVDVIKVGIGPGSACSTRVKTGVGMPQLTAVMLCAEEAKKHDVKILADGGITCPGDVSKAFVGGANFVMIGGEFAGHDETPGEIIEKDGKQYKEFYGMSSRKAMVKHEGKMEEYRTSEGRELHIPYRGKLDDTVLDYLGGIRSTCTYINVANLSDMRADKSEVALVRTRSQYNTHLL